MMHAADERFILASKENLTENMESFSLKVIRDRYLYYCAIMRNYCNISKNTFSKGGLLLFQWNSHLSSVRD